MHDELYTPKYCECGCGTELPIPKFPCLQRRFIYPHAQMRRGKPLAERFAETTTLATDLSPNGMAGCILWTGNLGPTGYGKIWYGGMKIPATHAAWIAAGRKRPLPGRDLDHLCRRHCCVNVDHLEDVSHAENVRRGSNTKLTAEQVREIRARRAAGEFTTSLGREFGVAACTISNIEHRTTWAHVD